MFTPVLIKLHWLPIKFRIQFKVLLLVYKALNGLAPKYIKELLVPYKPRRHLRSEAKGLLDEPRTRLKFGDRAFSISAPRLWNALPQHLKDSTSCQAFKKCLKTHLFRLAHWGVVDYYSNYDCAALLNILWMERALYKFQLLLLLLLESLSVPQKGYYYDFVTMYVTDYKHTTTIGMCPSKVLTVKLLVANLAITKRCKKNWKMTETLAHWYSSESTQR